MDRLVLVTSRIISPNQFSCIKGCQIVYCIAITSECANLLNKKSFGDNIAMKIEIRNIFDTLS